jgi:hypothetical protein
MRKKEGGIRQIFEATQSAWTSFSPLRPVPPTHRNKCLEIQTITEGRYHHMLSLGDDLLLNIKTLSVFCLLGIMNHMYVT